MKISLIFATLAAVHVEGFFPTNIRTFDGALGLSHEQITRNAFAEILLNVYNIGSPSDSMASAREQIAKADSDVDDDQTHPELHFDGESFVDGQNRLINLKAACVQALASNDVNLARLSLGQALHTLQDFYSHTNWIEMSGSVNMNLGMEGFQFEPLGPTVQTCQPCQGAFTSLDCSPCDKNLVGVGLTSGYYSGEPAHVKPGAWKCSHGGPFDGSSGSNILSKTRGQGINKDSSDCHFSPHFGLHDYAASFATQASIVFMEDIRSRVPDLQFQALYGIVTVAITTTSSESKRADGSTLEALAKSHSRNDHFLLVGSNDALSLTGVSALACSKRVKVHAIVQRGVVDEKYTTITHQTGGQILEFAANASEAEVSKIIDAIAQEMPATILNVASLSEGTIRFPADASLHSLRIIVSGDASVSVTPLPADAEKLKSGKTTVVTFASRPAVGQYTVKVSGACSVSVSGRSVLSLTKFNFVTMGGRPGHEGYYPLRTLPTMNTKTSALAFVNGNFTLAKFEMRSRSGRKIQELSLARGSGIVGDALDNEFIEKKTVTMPSEPFMIYITGFDATGNAFQRCISRSYNPTSVQLTTPNPPYLEFDKPVTYTLLVTNYNTSSTSYRFSATDSMSIIKSVSTTNFSLKPKQSKHIKITMVGEKAGINHIMVKVTDEATRKSTEAVVECILEAKTASHAVHTIMYANDSSIFTTNSPRLYGNLTTGSHIKNMTSTWTVKNTTTSSTPIPPVAISAGEISRSVEFSVVLGAVTMFLVFMVSLAL